MTTDDPIEDPWFLGAGLVQVSPAWPLVAAQLPIPRRRYIDQFSEDAWGDPSFEPTPAARWVLCGSPVLVLVGTDDRRFLIAEPAMTWRFIERVTTEVGEVELAVDLPFGKGDVDRVAGAVEAVTERRLAAFRVCPTCGDTVPPEYWLGTTCMAYACSGAVF